MEEKSMAPAMSDTSKFILKICDIKPKLETESAPRLINPLLLSQWHRKLKGIMLTFESQVWEIDDVPTKLQTLKSMDEETNNVLSLHENNLDKFSEEDAKCYKSIQKFRKYLQRHTEYVEQLLINNSSSFARRLMQEKISLQSQLNSREGIEEVVLHIHQEMELAKYELSQEVHHRMELEILLESKVHELSDEILSEALVRNDLSRRMERAMEIKKNIAGHLKLLKENLQMILEYQEQEEEIATEESREKFGIPSQTHDTLQLIWATSKIEQKLEDIGTCVDFTCDDVVEPPSPIVKLIETLTEKLTNEIAIRKAVEEKHLDLERQIPRLQNMLFDERLARIEG